MKLFRRFLVSAKAEVGQMSTAVVNSGNNVKLTNAIRTVYSKEIE